MDDKSNQNSININNCFDIEAIYPCIFMSLKIIYNEQCS